MPREPIYWKELAPLTPDGPLLFERRGCLAEIAHEGVVLNVVLRYREAEPRYLNLYSAQVAERTIESMGSVAFIVGRRIAILPDLEMDTVLRVLSEITDHSDRQYFGIPIDAVSTVRDIEQICPFNSGSNRAPRIRLPSRDEDMYIRYWRRDYIVSFFVTDKEMAANSIEVDTNLVFFDGREYTITIAPREVAIQYATRAIDASDVPFYGGLDLVIVNHLSEELMLDILDTVTNWPDPTLCLIKYRDGLQ